MAEGLQTGQREGADSISTSFENKLISSTNYILVLLTMHLQDPLSSNGLESHPLPNAEHQVTEKTPQSLNPSRRRAQLPTLLQYSYLTFCASNSPRILPARSE
jgi:hypothetical protein